MIYDSTLSSVKSKTVIHESIIPFDAVAINISGSFLKSY